MPRLCVEPERLAADALDLRGQDARYLGGALRLRAGDRLTLFDGQGREADAEVVAVARGRVRLRRISPPRAAPAPGGPSVALLVGLLKGAKMDLIVQKATELGVARVRPIVCARAVRGREAAERRLVRWAKIAREAARQCGRADVPPIDPPAPLAEALAATPPDALRLLVHPGGATWPGARVATAAAVALAIGPEGGFESGEVEVARRAGFEAVGMGPRTLRAETAAIVACAAATILATPPAPGYGSIG